MANIKLGRNQKIGIRNILSIRYNPLDDLRFEKITSDNLNVKSNDLSGLKTQQLLENAAVDMIPNTSEPISISLSAGIDSTLSLAIIRKVFPKRKIHAVCGVFENTYDESKTAQKIAEKFDAKFHTVNMDSIFVNLPKLVSITKRPKWNTYHHLIAKKANRLSKFYVTGDGADEIFAGYTFRYQKFLELTKSTDSWKQRIENYLECHNRDWVPDQMNLFGKSIAFSWPEIFSYFKPFFNNKLDPLQQVFLADFNGKLLYDFIPTGQAISEFYKLKITSLYLHPNVISYGLSLPTSQKYNKKNKKGKIVLRKIASRLNVKHIEKKRGFSPSLLLDWKKYGSDICQRYLDKNAYIYKKGIIRYPWFLQAFEKAEYDGDIRYINKLISILALEIWYQIFISKTMSPQKKLV